MQWSRTHTHMGRLNICWQDILQHGYLCMETQIPVMSCYPSHLHHFPRITLIFPNSFPLSLSQHNYLINCLHFHHILINLLRTQPPSFHLPHQSSPLQLPSSYSSSSSESFASSALRLISNAASMIDCTSRCPVGCRFCSSFCRRSSTFRSLMPARNDQ